MIDTIILAVVLCVIVGLYIWRQIVFDRRENDLITRLMSRDAVEYANVHRATRHVPPVTVADAVDILTQQGIDAEEILGSSGDESTDRVRVA